MMRLYKVDFILEQLPPAAADRMRTRWVVARDWSNERDADFRALHLGRVVSWGDETDRYLRGHTTDNGTTPIAESLRDLLYRGRTGEVHISCPFGGRPVWTFVDERTPADSLSPVFPASLNAAEDQRAGRRLASGKSSNAGYCLGCGHPLYWRGSRWLCINYACDLSWTEEDPSTSNFKLIAEAMKK